jgi:enoyl-CoA hydratase/carnithine racemase
VRRGQYKDVTGQFTEIDYQRSGCVGRLTLGRRENSVLTPTMIRELLLALDLVADEDLRFLVVTGVGRTFCADVDPDYVQRTAAAEHGFDRLVEDFLEPFADFIGRLRTVAEHVIGAVNGSCSAAGLWIVRACEYAVPADQVDDLVDRLSAAALGRSAHRRRPRAPSAARSPRPGVLR